MGKKFTRIEAKSISLGGKKEKAEGEITNELPKIEAVFSRGDRKVERTKLRSTSQVDDVRTAFTYVILSPRGKTTQNFKSFFRRLLQSGKKGSRGKESGGRKKEKAVRPTDSCDVEQKVMPSRVTHWLFLSASFKWNSSYVPFSSR